MIRQVVSNLIDFFQVNNQNNMERHKLLILIKENFNFSGQMVHCFFLIDENLFYLKRSGRSEWWI